MWDLDREIILSLSAPNFCESMNVATVVLYISRVPKVKGKIHDFFLPPSTGALCFPSKHTLVELWAFMCSGIFILCFCFALQKSKGICQRSWNQK